MQHLTARSIGTPPSPLQLGRTASTWDGALLASARAGVTDTTVELVRSVAVVLRRGELADPTPVLAALLQLRAAQSLVELDFDGRDPSSISDDELHAVHGIDPDDARSWLRREHEVFLALREAIDRIGTDMGAGLASC